MLLLLTFDELFKPPSFVSWNEFVHQMLAKGEVKQLIIKPDYDLVQIVLHDGAVIKGQRSVHKYYHIVMPNTTKLEEKVREAEKSLGIKPGEYYSNVFFHINN